MPSESSSPDECSSLRDQGEHCYHASFGGCCCCSVKIGVPNPADPALRDVCAVCGHTRGGHVHWGPDRLLTCLFCTSEDDFYSHAFELATPERVAEFMEQWRQGAVQVAAERAADVMCECGHRTSYHTPEGACVERIVLRECDCPGFREVTA